jgi:hypothetical protein
VKRSPSGNDRRLMSGARDPQCPTCGANVPASSRFCPECGHPLEAATQPELAEVPAARRRLWPPEPLLAVVVFIAAAGFILVVAGEALWGIVVLLLAGVLALVRQEGVRREVGRAVRGGLSTQRDVVTARSRGQLELFRARRELADLEAVRARGYAELGQAVFEHDESGKEAARTALATVVARIEEKGAEIQALIQEMDERVRRAQRGAQPTEQLSGESPSEPLPPRLPEPYPPPDEGSPPAPAPVPEPSPDDPPPEPEHPPLPREQSQKSA